MHINFEAPLLGACLLCDVFPNCEQLISISFLINVISPLFNHIAYRHVLESQLKKKAIKDPIWIWDNSMHDDAAEELALWKEEVIIILNS